MRIIMGIVVMESYSGQACAWMIAGESPDGSSSPTLWLHNTLQTELMVILPWRRRVAGWGLGEGASCFDLENPRLKRFTEGRP